MEDADEPQEYITLDPDQIPRAEDLDKTESRTVHPGTCNTKGISIDNDILEPDEEDRNLRNKDTEYLCDIYSVLRKSADRRYDGKSILEGFWAEYKGVPPGLMTEAESGTVEDWRKKFKSRGLMYEDSSGSDVLTTEAEILGESLERLENDFGLNMDTQKDREKAAEMFNLVSRRASNQGNLLEGFLYAYETNKSVTEISENMDAVRKTAYNWFDKWNGEYGDQEEGETASLRLIDGKKDREITPYGDALYDLVQTHYDRLSTAAEMKAETMRQLDERGIENVGIPGPSEFVSKFADEELVNKYMET